MKNLLNEDYLSEGDLINRMTLYGALWAFCDDYHSGQSSRGYRILCKLERAGYKPGLSLRKGFFESEEQHDMYIALVEKYWDKV